MGKPKVYFVKLRCGWNPVDSFLKIVAVNPVLNVCRSRGYAVVEQSGCSTAQFNQLLKKPDTYGVIVTGGHGDLAGPQFDPADKNIPCEKNTKTLRSYLSDPASQSITDNPNPNLKFVLFHACNISRGTLGEYKKRLRKTAKEAEVWGWPGKNLYSLQGLPKGVAQVCENLPDQTQPRPLTVPVERLFVPYQTIPKVPISASFYMNHTVRFGDRVWYLAETYGYKDSQKFVDDVKKLNPGIDVTRLQPGQQINVPSMVKKPKLKTPYALRAKTIPVDRTQPNQLSLLKNALDKHDRIQGEGPIFNPNQPPRPGSLNWIWQQGNRPNPPATAPGSQTFPPNNAPAPAVPSPLWQQNHQKTNSNPPFSSNSPFGNQNNPFNHSLNGGNPASAINNPLRNMWNQGLNSSSSFGNPSSGQFPMGTSGSNPFPGAGSGRSSPSGFGPQGSLRPQLNSGPAGNPLRQMWIQGNNPMNSGSHFSGGFGLGSSGGSLRPPSAPAQPGSLQWMAQGLKR